MYSIYYVEKWWKAVFLLYFAKKHPLPFKHGYEGRYFRGQVYAVPRKYSIV